MGEGGDGDESMDDEETEEGSAGEEDDEGEEGGAAADESDQESEEARARRKKEAAKRTELLRKSKCAATRSDQTHTHATSRAGAPPPSRRASLPGLISADPSPPASLPPSLPLRSINPFSGKYSPSCDKNMAKGAIEHNNMHHVPAPVYFKGASELEISLVCRIATVVNLHVLRGGMLSATGHVITLVNKMSLATALPLTCAETGYILLHDSKSPKSKAYLVSREKVEEMLNGLCFGEPKGGLVPGDREWPFQDETQAKVAGWARYDGPDQVRARLLRWLLAITPTAPLLRSTPHELLLLLLRSLLLLLLLLISARFPLSACGLLPPAGGGALHVAPQAVVQAGSDSQPLLQRRRHLARAAGLAPCCALAARLASGGAAGRHRGAY